MQKMSTYNLTAHLLLCERKLLLDFPHRGRNHIILQFFLSKRSCDLKDKSFKLLPIIHPSLPISAVFWVSGPRDYPS